MPVCPGIKRDGTRCTVAVEGPHSYCYQHDPARAGERRRSASRAGKSKPSRELADIKTLLSDLTSRVLGEEGTKALSTGAAAVANQLTQTRLRAIEIERKIKETDELEERIEQLEQTREQKGGERWRA